MRSFRHLNRNQISEIIALHLAQTPQAEIARTFNVDHSTIHYHLKKYEEAYPEQGGVYSLIKVGARKVCIHPSGRCTLCGEMWDELRRQERETIEWLTTALEEANSRLRVAGLFVE